MMITPSRKRSGPSSSGYLYQGEIMPIKMTCEELKKYLCGKWFFRRSVADFVHHCGGEVVVENHRWYLIYDNKRQGEIVITGKYGDGYQVEVV
jgi:hypothetical protein